MTPFDGPEWEGWTVYPCGRGTNAERTFTATRGGTIEIEHNCDNTDVWIIQDGARCGGCGERTYVLFRATFPEAARLAAEALRLMSGGEWLDKGEK